MAKIPPNPFLRDGGFLLPMWRIPFQQGWSCFPVPVREKRPSISWRIYQTEAAALERVQQWAQRPSNVAICTGAVSGLVVLDLDSDAAIREAERLGLPETVTAKTGKGRHVYFRHPGGTIKNRAGIFSGADIRGDGGYVIAPGSEHPSGARYEWIDSPDVTALAPMPDWLLTHLTSPGPATPDMAQPTEPARLLADRGPDAHWQRSIDAELYTLRWARQGERNDQLNKSAFLLAQLSAGHGFDWLPAEARLREAAFQIGLETREIEATIRSAREKGFLQPRALHGPPVTSRTTVNRRPNGTPYRRAKGTPCQDCARLM